MKKPDILAIIPARGGSKEIPHKNIKEFASKPLIAHILATAQKSNMITRVVVSTEDTKIAAVVRSYGIELIKRPAELAFDHVPTVPVLVHALEYLQKKENYSPDHVVLLYATSPLLRVESLDKSLRDYLASGADSGVGVVESYDKFWKKTQKYGKILYPKKRANRQQTKPIYRESGSLYIVRAPLLAEKHTLFGKNTHLALLNHDECVDIDTMSDFKYAEFLYSQRP